MWDFAKLNMERSEHNIAKTIFFNRAMKSNLKERLELKYSKK